MRARQMARWKMMERTTPGLSLDDRIDELAQLDRWFGDTGALARREPE
jgi:hypothetical protein